MIAMRDLRRIPLLIVGSPVESGLHHFQARHDIRRSNMVVGLDGLTRAKSSPQPRDVIVIHQSS